MRDNKEQAWALRVVWDGAMETGVTTIDLQHKVLFDLLLNTREAWARGRPVELDGLLRQLRSYAGYHFRHEEEWIRKHCPLEAELPSHCVLHTGFLDQLDRLEQRMREDRLSLDRVLVFLSDWLLNHIVRQDVPLIRGLAQVGERV